jgi:hypothetical protein
MALPEADQHSMRVYRNNTYREALVSPDAGKRRVRNTKLLLLTRDAGMV